MIRRLTAWRRAAQDGIGGDPRWLEAFSGAAAMLWAVAVLRLPADLHSHPGYASLGLLLPPLVWAALFLAGGALQLAAVLLDHAEARVPIAAAVGAGWLLLAYDLAAALPGTPTSYVVAALGLANGGAMLRLIRQAVRGGPR